MEPERLTVGQSNQSNHSNNNSNVNIHNQKKKISNPFVNTKRDDHEEMASRHRFTVENEKCFQATSAINYGSIMSNVMDRSEVDSGFEDFGKQKQPARRFVGEFV